MTESLTRYHGIPPVTPDEHLRAIEQEMANRPELDISLDMADIIYTAHALAYKCERVQKLCEHYRELTGGQHG